MANPRNVKISSIGEKEEVTISLINKNVTLVFSEFEGHVDVDELTKIDICNLTGEMLTISTLLNRVGLLRAQAMEDLEIYKLDLNLLRTEIRRRKRQEAKDEGISATTMNKWLDDEVTADQGHQMMEKSVVRAQKTYDMLDSLYWAVKSKDEKLKNMSQHFTPIDMETNLTEGEINSLFIRVSKNDIFKDPLKTR